MIHDQQEAWIRDRFKHYDPARCAELFHEDQPPGGIHTRKQREFPAIVFKTSVVWYPCREERPVHRDGQSPVKSDAPARVRPLLYDTLEPEELVIVEGEGHLVACVSVGLRGVVTAGGTGGLVGRSDAAFANRGLLRNKSIRILFDPDEQGCHAAPRLQAALKEAGATRVAVVDLRQAGCAPDADVEDWLGDFDTPAAAYSALTEVLAAADWGAQALVDGQPSEQPIRELLFNQPGDAVPTLVTMVWDGEAAQLAVYGTVEEETDPEDSPRPGSSVEHDEPAVNPDAPRTWRLVDTYCHEGVTYTPDLRGDVKLWLKFDSLVLPPPPSEEPDSSKQLWTDLVSFYQAWFACEPRYYDVMAAYCLLTYRLEDAGFDHIGFLRFVGPPSTGKNRGLDMMRYTCWTTYTAQPTSANLHRVVDYFGNCTLVIDEFHPTRGRTDTQVKDLMDLLNFSFQRNAMIVRMDRLPDGNMVPGLYRVFGPKVFASYTADEDEAFTRRGIIIPTGKVEPTSKMMKPQLPPEAKDEARLLRARLLAWRARKLASGLPPLGGATWGKLLKVAGSETSQVFWPLVEMVPRDHRRALENLVEIAGMRRDAVRETRHATEESYLLDTVAGLWESGGFHRVDDGWFISSAEIAAELPDERYMSASRVARVLKSLGLCHCVRRYDHGGQKWQRKGFEIVEHDDVAAIMEQHGVAWPRPNGSESGFQEAAPL
jgi:5S rRNA maturation endonuclease (ribonuclease M5)